MIASIRRLTAAVRAESKQPPAPSDLPRWTPTVTLSDEQLRRLRDSDPPPVGIEMCTRQIGTGALTHGQWIAGPTACLTKSCSNEKLARRRGDSWLKSLGVEAPPVEVEVAMRLNGHTHGGVTWQCCLMGIWTAPACYADDECGPVLYLTELSARGNGERWLAALSKHLGVPLKAKWVTRVSPDEP